MRDVYIWLMNSEIMNYIEQLPVGEREICNFLTSIIDQALLQSESKLWHAHPVWFLEGNPIVGFSKQKKGIRLMFWSGADFDEPMLNEVGKKFKDASIFYNSAEDIDIEDLKRWLSKSIITQWDYKNIVKRKGRLERLF